MSDQSFVNPTHCAMCGSPLIRINFRKGFVLVCDNWPCYKYRAPQYTELTEAPILPFMTKRGKYIFRERKDPNKNPVILHRRRERYHYARDHGLPSVLAGAICGNSYKYIDGQIALFTHEVNSLKC